jgi:hypothetical protein
MPLTNAHAEVNAVLERIRSLWAQLPGSRRGSKLHKALLARIQAETAAYLRITDAARGSDRKAGARAGVPVQ